ncbi:MAG: hypothetical protein JW809_17150 [Pirellulales bacterium]|nr:hypothetical protein [Pirellulales bacterium]
MIKRRYHCLFAVLLLSAAVECPAAETTAQHEPDDPAPSMRLVRELDLGEYPGTFPCLGDLDNDGQVDFLLYRQGPQTTPGYLVALDNAGKKLWEKGDRSIASHQPDGAYNEPALRGIALIFDVDRDGRSEVVAELWENDRPELVILDGKTGRVERSRPSPFDLKVRSGRRSRCHPVGRIARFAGQDGPPTIVLKYGASGHAPSCAVALDASLDVLWRLDDEGNAMGHVPTVADVDGDGRDEVMLGRVLVDASGKVLWRVSAERHADCTAAFKRPGRHDMALLVSICTTGPAFCLAADGAVLWQKTRKEVPHGQGVWVGNFLADEPGDEAIILRSGHVGDFLTVRAADGSELARFRQTVFEGYPDFPCAVNWKGDGEQSLWVPIDRRLVDGRGRTVAALGDLEDRVRQKLQWGTTKSHVAAQAFAVDLCGDPREEIVLYQPYHGRSIFILTQPDSRAEAKPYAPQKNAYNMATYF